MGTYGILTDERMKRMAWKTENERLEYAQKAGKISEKITQILKMESGDIITAHMQSQLEKYKKEADSLQRKLQNDEFEIAIVGLEKAGKSSFSNALIEKAMLPTDDERCTYTATCIRYADQDMATVRFYEQNKFDKDFVDKLNKVGIQNADDYSYRTLSLEKYETLYEECKDNRYSENLNEDIRNIIENREELSRYLGMSEKVYKGSELNEAEFRGFIRRPGQAIAVEEVSIWSKELQGIQNAVIYDVPGFNSPTQMHRNQTLNKMENADAIIMVAKGDEPSLTGDVLQIFRESDRDGTPLRDKLFIFANKSDRATDFGKNQERTYEEWIKRYKYISEEEKSWRIIFGSANAHLQKCGQLQGDHFIRSVQEKNLPDGDGIDRIKAVLEQYNRTQRAEVLKRRIRRLQQDVKQEFAELGDYDDNGMQEHGGEKSKLITHTINRALTVIPEKLSELNSAIRAEMEQSPLSKHISEKIKEVVSLGDYELGREIRKRHDKYAGVNGSEEVSRVEGDIRKECFEKMYDNFSREIVDMALSKHEKCEKEIINKCLEGIGVKKGAASEAELRKALCSLLEKEGIIKEEKGYYQSLVERFSRDLYEILVRTPYTNERSRIFCDNSNSFYSMSIFYRTEKEDNSFINEKISDLPMCRMLLFHTYKEEKENITKAYEKIKEFFVNNNEELLALVKLLGKAAPFNVVEIVADVCRETVQESDEFTRICDAKELLKRHLRERQSSQDEKKTADITDKDQFLERYREYHAKRGNRNYDMMQQDFMDDIQILQDILQNAFIYAIDIEKPFLAKEQKIIEHIKGLVSENSFWDFIAENIWLIRREECNAIGEKEKKNQLNQACMERIRELLIQLDWDCAG